MKVRTSVDFLQKQKIVCYLFQRSWNGKLPWGAFSKCAQCFNMHKNTVIGVWRHYEQLAKNFADLPYPKIMCHQNGNTWPVFYDREEMWQIILDLPISARTTIQGIATHLGISTGTVQNLIHKEGIILPYKNKIKSTLSNLNKWVRVEYCMDKHNAATGFVTYKNMANVVMSDEKWFYLTQSAMKTYLVEGEQAPHRTT